MKCITIGVTISEYNNKENIMKIFEKSKLLKTIPHAIYYLEHNELSPKFIYKNSKFDILIIEEGLEINIFIRYIMGNNITLEQESFLKAIFIKKSEQIIYTLIYKIIELKDFYIYSKNDKGLFKNFFCEISYIEVSERKTIIHTANNQLITYKSLKTYNDMLDHRFFRCHASYIVNLDYIASINYPDIYLITSQK